MAEWERDCLQLVMGSEAFSRSDLLQVKSSPFVWVTEALEAS